MRAKNGSNDVTRRVSRRVPSTSNRTARRRDTSGLLLGEPPDLVADMMERLDRLALLLTGHRRTVHDRSAHRERLAILFVPDPDNVSLANRRIRFRDPGGHHVRAVVDEPHRAHVDGHGALRRGEREETPDPA